MRESVVFQRGSEKLSEVIKPAGYAVRREMLTGWRLRLADWLWAALWRLNALQPYYFNQIFWKYRDYEGTLGRQLSGMYLDLVRSGKEPSDYVIVCGHEQMTEISRSAMTGVPDGDFYIAYGDVEYGRAEVRHMYRDVPVFVLPYLRGWAAIPRSILASREATPPVSRVDDSSFFAPPSSGRGR